jgi:YD repeat-containing protein
MSQQSQPYLPPNSAPPGTAYSYDALGRTVKVLLADGASFTTYTYQGNFTTITDPPPATGSSTPTTPSETW